MQNLDGILPLWKEKGLTSHDCVFKARKILHMKKIGHTGTLDPNVDGVLPLCLGKGTKLVDLIMDKTKTYVGEITLGFATETEDLDGKIIDELAIDQPILSEVIDQKMQEFKGIITQIPPMYSAVKVNGRRLYEYARANETVERPTRQVEIHQFKRTSSVEYDNEKHVQRFKFEVVCGKGTYIRTLASNLGESLGVPATMIKLTRTGSSPFSKNECLTLAEVKQAVTDGSINQYVWSIDRVLNQYPTWEVPAHLIKLIRNGAVIDKDQLPKDLSDEPIVAAQIDNQIIGLYGPHPTKENKVKPKKMF